MMKPVNILLVDDREEGLLSLESVLKNSAYNLMKAMSGREALAFILEHDFAVILMDVQMPDMDGFETATIIKSREKSKNIPIIFMTANSKSDHYINVGYSVGAVDYVLKPFDPYILKSKVSVFVDLHRKNQILKEQSDVLRDIERRERGRVLHDLEVEGRRRYQNLADAIPQIVFRANSMGDIEYLNQYWIRFTGKSLEQSAGLLWQESVHPRDLSEIQDKWIASRQTQLGFEVECRVRQEATGDYRWHILRVVPEFSGQQHLVNWIGVATDIHDQKLTQQELILAKKLAEVASETKSNFLANMSHEIRTPLGIILGFSELLIDDSISPKEKAEAIAAVRRNGQQLSKIIDEILDLSKVEAGKMDFEKTEISLIDLVRSVKGFMSLPAKEKGIHLNFKIKNKIPSSIYSNQTRLQQILVNLIGNAIKFSPKGNVKVEVAFETQNGKPTLIFRVKDSGPGLTAAQIENLFQPFTQVDTSMTRKHGGTGLGLALSRRLAKALGGDISVNASKPGEGCEFVVTTASEYPENTIFVDNMNLPGPAEKKAASKESDVPLKDCNILLVEDSVDNQWVITRFLTMAGAKVDVANNGLEGVDKALGGNHDVILMDIQMPELDGYGAITELRKKGYAKPIVALTAHGMVEDKKRCLEVGSDSHLTKPIDRAVLIERLVEMQKISVSGRAG